VGVKASFEILHWESLDLPVASTRDRPEADVHGAEAEDSSGLRAVIRSAKASVGWHQNRAPHHHLGTSAPDWPTSKHERMAWYRKAVVAMAV
jgi:hypothetical protein